MAEVGATFKPGEKVPHSGIYDVIHDPIHAQRHQVTCVYDDPFPAVQSLRSSRPFSLGCESYSCNARRELSQEEVAGSKWLRERELSGLEVTIGLASYWIVAT